MNSEVLHEQARVLHGQAGRPLKTTAAREKQYGKQPEGIKEVKRVKIRNSINKQVRMSCSGNVHGRTANGQSEETSISTCNGNERQVE